MAEKELRRMNRTELIEIIYALQQNDKTLQQENEEMRRQLSDKQIRIEQSGSIAEAALSLNHIFEDAEAAVQQYLESVRSAFPLPREDQEDGALVAPEEAGSQPMDGETELGKTAGKSDGMQEPGKTAGKSDSRQEPGKTAEKSDGMQEPGRATESGQDGKQIYLEETQLECEKLLESTQLECDLLRSEVQSDCDKLRNEAQSDCDKLRNEAQSECDRMRSEAETECKRIRRETMQQAKEKMDIVEKGINLALDKYPMLKEYLKEELKTGGDSQ